MLHLTCGTSFLLLFVFLISLVHHHHPALLHRQALILDRLLTFLVVFCTLVLKPSFSESISLHSHLFFLLRLISWNLTTQCLAVTGGVVLANVAD